MNKEGAVNAEGNVDAKDNVNAENNVVWDAAVIGLGAIGCGYDRDKGPGVSQRITTHARAYRLHKGFNLVAGVDPNTRQRQLFSEEYKLPAYESLAELFQQHSPKAISLCVPTPIHRKAFEELLPYKPKAVLCEKPLASTLLDSIAIQNAAKDANVLLQVNFMRRFEPEVNRLRGQLVSGKLGKVFKGVVWYSGGILNSASHFIDLLLWLFPDDQLEVQVLKDNAEKKGDAAFDFCLSGKQRRIYFCAVESTYYRCNEMELLAEQGSVRYGSSGMAIHTRLAEENPWFRPEVWLAENSTARKTDLLNYQYHSVDALYQAMLSGKQSASNAETALQTQKIVETLLQHSNEPK